MGILSEYLLMVIVGLLAYTAINDVSTEYNLLYVQLIKYDIYVIYIDRIIFNGRSKINTQGTASASWLI